jgi:hypothetical protein
MAAAFLAESPTYLPAKHVRLPDGMTLVNAVVGDLIAVNLRWLRIVRPVTNVDGWVTVRFDDPGIDGITAKETIPVHLARKESIGASTAVAPGV